jgi:hypothetical protein
MNYHYIIRDYCTIRENQVGLSGKVLFTGGERLPASFLPEVYKHFNINYPKFYKMDDLCKLGFLTSELLLHGKNIPERYAGEDIGIILCNAASSVDTDWNHQQSIHDRSAYFPSPSVFVYTLANIVIGEICIRNKFYGEGTFFIEEFFNVNRIHAYVRQLFDDNILQCCLTGWIEMNGDHYDGMMYLVEKSTSGKEGIATFDPRKLTEIYSKRN